MEFDPGHRCRDLGDLMLALWHLRVELSAGAAVAVLDVHADQYRVSGSPAAENAAKLLGVFGEQLQALQCYRGKAPQKVTVEHAERE